MKERLEKTLRVSAAVATLLMTHASGLAFDSVDDAVTQLSNSIICQNYISGPWIVNSNLKYVSIYDNCTGAGELVGTDATALTFKNFVIPGLNVDATITEETLWGSTVHYLNIKLDKVYTISTGSASEYMQKYEGKYAKIYTTYVDPNQTWSQLDCGLKTIDDKNYAFIRPASTDEDTYKINMSWSGSLRDNNGSALGLIIAIYNDAECQDLYDAKSFIQGAITYPYQHNAVAEDYDLDGNLIRKYNLYYTTEGHSYKFFNLNALGQSVNLNGGKSDATITATWDWDNELVTFEGNGLISSTTDNSGVQLIGKGTLKSLGIAEDESDDVDAFWFSYDASKRTTLTTISPAEGNYYQRDTSKPSENLATFGYYGADSSTIDHNHKKTSCPWITNDGDRTTGSSSVDFFFDDYGLAYWTNSDGSDAYPIDMENSVYKERYSETRIYNLDLGSYITEDRESLDCTLGVSLELEQFGSNDDCIYVKGNIKPTANTQYVDHYELCVKPGTEASVKNFADGYKVAELGFVGATNISASSYDFTSTSQSVRPYRVKLTEDTEESDVISFSKLIPKSDLNEKASSNSDYSFYVMAVYNNDYAYDSTTDTGLNPTFHDIQSSNITTGVESVTDQGNGVKIFGEQGEIEVIGDVDSVVIYSISGAEVYSGCEKSISVPAGIYIVKAGNAVAKVVVK